MAVTLIDKLRSLTDCQLFEVITSRDLSTSLQSKLCIKATPEVDYLPENLVTEIISDALSSVISDGFSRLDVIAFYHVMVEALDCCGQFTGCIKILEYILSHTAKYGDTDEAMKHFSPTMNTSTLQFITPHARSLVEHHVIMVFQHFYLYHHVMTEVQEVEVSNTLVTCHTPTHHPHLKEGAHKASCDPSIPVVL